MLLGICQFGYVLGELASNLTNASAKKVLYQHRLETVINYLVCVCVLSIGCVCVCGGEERDGKKFHPKGWNT